MADLKEVLSGLNIFSGLDQDELAKVADLAKEITFKEGEVVFQEGDPSGTLYIILEGSIQISTKVMEDLDKPLVTLGEGKLFGEVSLIDQNPREARAKAISDTKMLSLSTEDFNQLRKQSPELGIKILDVLTRTVVGRIRLTMEQFRRNIQWGLEVSGALELNWHRLITDEVQVQLELVGGRIAKGTFLKVENSNVGYELFILGEDGKVSIIPYHAVLSIGFDRLDVMATKAQLGE